MTVSCIDFIFSSTTTGNKETVYYVGDLNFPTTNGSDVTIIERYQLDFFFILFIINPKWSKPRNQPTIMSMLSFAATPALRNAWVLAMGVESYEHMVKKEDRDASSQNGNNLNEKTEKVRQSGSNIFWLFRNSSWFRMKTDWKGVEESAVDARYVHAHQLSIKYVLYWGLAGQHEIMEFMAIQIIWSQ